MAVRTTVDIPEPLHDQLRRRAESSGTSIRSLIVSAIEQTYSGPRKGTPVTGPLIRGTGKLGPGSPPTRIRMTLFFPDLNVWLALSVAGHAQSAAWNWMDSLHGDDRLILSRFTQIGLSAASHQPPLWATKLSPPRGMGRI